MKRINNEQILDTIYDLADSAGMRIDEFLMKVEEQFGEPMPNTDGLPEDVATELLNGRESQKQLRRQSRAQKDQQAVTEEIKRFREMFPDVPAEEIPEEVWEDVSNGASLPHAYALYLINEENLKAYAEEVNGRNKSRGAKASSDGATEPVFTKEQVERMSGKDIKNNYKSILKAMKSWRFN